MRDREHKRKRVLCDGFRQHARGIGNNHGMAPHRFEINIIKTDSIIGKDLALGSRRRKHIFIDLIGKQA